MFILVEGTVEIDFEARGQPRLGLSERGTPIGEIGFLRGCPAIATVRARSDGRYLVIDDSVLAPLERGQAPLAAAFLHHLARTAEERTSFNLTFAPPQPISHGSSVEVLLCRNPELLLRAQRLRYEVYCEELKRRSPFADHAARTISDSLDSSGHTFIAVEEGATIGTLRGNLPTEGPVGIYEQLYGMRNSPHHPKATSVCTKFIVRKSKRGGPAAMKLISAIVRFGLHHGVRECYIDCVPGLLPYYKALGFTMAGQKFFHRENGPSFPMVLDVSRHGRRLSRDADVRDYFKIYVRAQFIRTFDRLHAMYSKPQERGGSG
jgi:N-acyl-L-homoserine lactone synthetase